jgi:serine/threonine-protein kinase
VKFAVFDDKIRLGRKKNSWQRHLLKRLTFNYNDFASTEVMNVRTEFVSYEFGSFRVDTLKRRLYRDGVPVQVTSKSFDTLAVLLAHNGETVTKADLMNSVWGDTAVEENNLTQQISALRRALGERARDHKFIVTVPGRGYSFVAFVREVSECTETERSAGSISETPLRSLAYDPSSLFGMGLAIAYALIVCLPAFLLSSTSDAVFSGPRSVAILTFRSAGTDEEPLGIGIRDTLRAKLGSLDDLTVRPGSSDLAYQDAIDAGRRMHADVVLTGSIQRDEGRVRVAVEIVDVSSERIVWGRTFDESYSNIFELQDSIAGEVIRVLQRNRRSLSKEHGPAGNEREFETVRFSLPRKLSSIAC